MIEIDTLGLNGASLMVSHKVSVNIKQAEIIDGFPSSLLS